MTESGVRADVVVEQPTDCPVAAASAEMDADAEDVRWAEAGDDTVTEQFVADGPAEEAVFDYGDRQVYEIERDAEVDCVCERVEALDCPIADVRAVDGDLQLTLYLSGVEDLRRTLAELRDRYEGVRVARLSRTGDDGEDSDPVPVDRGRLTDRQREVLETAREMGYFEYPRGANASEVAEELGIGTSTLIEHLAVAQGKVVDDLLA